MVEVGVGDRKRFPGLRWQRWGHVCRVGAAVGGGKKLESHRARPCLQQEQTTALKHSPNKWTI